jgi:hypothetical protein
MLGAIPDWVVGLDSATAFIVGAMAGVLYMTVRIVLDDRRRRECDSKPTSQANRSSPN